jgi:hypothetical protein
MSDIVERLAKRCSHTEKTCPECAGDRRDALAEIERLREALARIADKDAWAAKYPFGNYECIAVESIGIARDALRATDQPAVVLFDDGRDDPYLYPTELTMSYQDAINAHFQQCFAQGKEPDLSDRLLQATLDFLDCRDDSPNPIEAIREYLRTADQQAACTRIDAGLVQPNSGTSVPNSEAWEPKIHGTGPLSGDY